MRDPEFEQFVAAYPAARRVTNQLGWGAFLNARQRVDFATMMAALAQHKRSEQWQQHIIPMMTKWLQEERWVQILPEPQIPDSRLTPGELARRYGK